MSVFLDEQQFSELRELMAEDFATLIAAYLRDSSDRLQQIAAACSDGDLAGVRRHAHSLKGSSSNVGASGLANHCQQLELLAMAAQTTKLNQQLDLLQRELAGVHGELRQHLS